VRDIAALGAIPNLLMAEPALEAEVRALFDYFVNTETQSAYLRLVSVKWPMPFVYPAELAVRKGRGWVVREGRDIVVFGYGPWLLANAWHAAEEIERSRGISARVINLPWLNHVDSAWLRDVIGTTRAVVTLDNHYVRGGQGQMIATAIAGLRLEAAVTVSTIGVAKLPECGTNDEVLGHHGLDIASLADVIRTAAEYRPRSIASQIA
jgi:transketolase